MHLPSVPSLVLVRLCSWCLLGAMEVQVLPNIPEILCRIQDLLTRARGKCICVCLVKGYQITCMHASLQTPTVAKAEFYFTSEAVAGWLPSCSNKAHSCILMVACEALKGSHFLLAQGIQGVRFKRLIMDESASDRSPHPPQEEGFKRIVFCSGKVRCAHSPTLLILPLLSSSLPSFLPG